MAHIVVVDTVAELRELNVPVIQSCVHLRVVRISGYHTAVDGAGGPDVVWSPDSTAADDGLSVFQSFGMAKGRWLRQLQDVPAINVLWGGAVGDGVTDDTQAVQAAYDYVKSLGRGTVLFPAGKIFKLARFVRMHSFTTTWVLGTVDCHNKAGGLYALQDQDVHVFGFGTGMLTDSTITPATFIFNQINYGPVFTISPCVHFRGCSDCSVNDININYATVGLWASNCSANSFPSSSDEIFADRGCTGIAFRNINSAFTEGECFLGHNSTELTWTGGRIYRSADGGITMFGCSNSFIGGGMIRESPYGDGTSAAINDQEGLALEACKAITISDIRIIGVAFDPIGIKNCCSRIVVDGAEIYDCQAGGIVTYDGDAVKNAVAHVTIRNVRIKNLGYPHYPNDVVSFRHGGIYSDSTFCIDIDGVTFDGYQSYPCIALLGPGSYLAGDFPNNPRQAYATVKNVSVSMRNPSSTNGDYTYELTSSTPDAIVISGLYDSITLDGITIKGDWFYSSDTRVNPNGRAIVVAADVTTRIKSSIVWPLSIDVKNVNINNWNMGGVQVAGRSAAAQTSIQLTGIKVGFVAGAGIEVDAGFAVHCTGCYVAAPGNDTTSHFGFDFDSCRRVLFTGNSCEGRSLGGGNVMSWGVNFVSCDQIDLGMNSIGPGTLGTINTAGCTNLLTSVTRSF